MSLIWLSPSKFLKSFQMINTPTHVYQNENENKNAKYLRLLEKQMGRERLLLGRRLDSSVMLPIYFFVV